MWVSFLLLHSVPVAGGGFKSNGLYVCFNAPSLLYFVYFASFIIINWANWLHIYEFSFLPCDFLIWLFISIGFTLVN